MERTSGSYCWRTSKLAVDCTGECGGSAEIDECGVCDGDNSTCADCNGEPNGDALVDDCSDCSSPADYNSGQDDCGVCYGDNADQDCAGECFGDSWDSDCGCVAADNSGND